MINKGNIQPEAGYEVLAIQIVKCACYDYLEAMRKLKYYETEQALEDVLKRKSVQTKKQAKTIIEEERKRNWGILKSVESFFYSQWYFELCDVPPEKLIRILQEKFNNHQNKANEIIWKELKKKNVTAMEICKAAKISSATLYYKLNKELPEPEKKKFLKYIRKYAKQRDLV